MANKTNLVSPSDKVKPDDFWLYNCACSVVVMMADGHVMVNFEPQDAECARWWIELIHRVGITNRAEFDIALDQVRCELEGR
jgi:hypothetical protein